jgi:hypothetical protein
MRTIRSWLLVVACLIAPLWTAVQAQNSAPAAYSLKLQKYAGIPNGTAALVVGETANAAHRFYVENLNMTQPVRITLRTNQADNPVRAVVTKFAWTEPEREGTTGDTGNLQLSFRTQGEFQVALTSNTPGAPYRMLVWVGDEVAKDMPPVIVPKARLKDSSGGSSSPMLWAIIGLLVVVIALLAAMLLKRRRA